MGKKKSEFLFKRIKPSVLKQSSILVEEKQSLGVPEQATIDKEDLCALDSNIST